jgi:hypothetical protein
MPLVALGCIQSTVAGGVVTAEVTANEMGSLLESSVKVALG